MSLYVNARANAEIEVSNVLVRSLLCLTLTAAYCLYIVTILRTAYFLFLAFKDIMRQEILMRDPSTSCNVVAVTFKRRPIQLKITYICLFHSFVFYLFFFRYFMAIWNSIGLEFFFSRGASASASASMRIFGRCVRSIVAHTILALQCACLFMHIYIYILVFSFVVANDFGG